MRERRESLLLFSNIAPDQGVRGFTNTTSKASLNSLGC